MNKFANLIGYSDITPYEVLRVISDKTIEIREMKSELDPSWKPEMIPGGFSAHTVNNSEQKWVITPNVEGLVVRARLQKNGKWKSAMGEHRLSTAPRRFYDYNF